MNHRGGSRHSDTITRANALVQLRLLLTGCTDAALNAMTVERLIATHRVTLKEAEYELTIERQRRARAA